MPLSAAQPSGVDTSQLSVAEQVVTPPAAMMAPADEGTGAQGPKYSPLDMAAAEMRATWFGKAYSNVKLMRESGVNPLLPYGTGQGEEGKIPEEMLAHKAEFAGLYSPEEITYKTNQIKQRELDSRIMGSSKWAPVMGVAAGLTDPANLLFPELRAGRLANTVRLGVFGGAVTAGEEALQHQLDPESTNWKSAALNVGVGTLLGGALGAAIKGHMPAAEFERLRARMTEDLKALAPRAAPEPIGDSAAAISADIRAAVEAHGQKLEAAVKAGEGINPEDVQARLQAAGEPLTAETKQQAITAEAERLAQPEAVGQRLQATYGEQLPQVLQQRAEGAVTEREQAAETLRTAAQADQEKLQQAEAAQKELMALRAPATEELQDNRARAGVEALINKATQRIAMEEHGQAILDDMEEKGGTPRSVSERFWQDTYPKLGADGKRLFEQQARALGFEPGSVSHQEADGTVVKLKDWPDVGRFLAEDMTSVEHLEGSQRGYVASMQWANEKAAAQPATAAYQAQKLLAAPTLPLKRAIADTALRDQLTHMAENEGGWAQVGGKLMRAEEGGPVTGRTPWIPNAEWWPGRPGGYNAAEVQGIVKKALAGERLGPKQAKLVEYMTEVADQRIASEEYLPTADDMPAEISHTDPHDAFEAAMVARLNVIDEAAVENLARYYEDDDVGFMAGVKRMLDAYDTDASLARRGTEDLAPTGESLHGPAAEGTAGPPERANLSSAAAGEGGTAEPGAAPAERKPVTGNVVELLARLPEDQRAAFEERLRNLVSQPIYAAPGASTAGAMEVGAATTLKDLGLARGGRGIAAALGWFAPGSRLRRSPSLEVRKTATYLSETPEMLNLNEPSAEFPQGRPTPHAVESYIRGWNGRVMQAYHSFDTNYRTYLDRVHEENRALPPGAERAPVLKEREFSEEVSAAARRGDKHAIPEVAQTARAGRALAIDPLKVAAQDTGLLPKQEDLLQGTADSYLMRKYDTGRIRADPIGWQTVLTDGFRAQGLDMAEATDIAHKVTANVLGSEMGFLDHNPSVFHDVVPTSGRLKARQLLMPDTHLEPYLVSDYKQLLRSYVKTLAPQVEITRHPGLGDKDLKEPFGRIADEYAILQQRALAANDAKTWEKLTDRMNADLRDLKAERDRLYGIFGTASDPSSWINRAGRVMRSVNVFRFLGMANFSHMPDVGNVTLRHGLGNTMGAALKLATSLNALKLNRLELHRMGTATDMYFNSTAALLNDVASDSRYPVQAAINATARGYIVATGELPWIATIKSIGGAIAHDQILEAAERAATGQELSNIERIRFNQAGLSGEMLERIGQQHQQFGRQINGLRFGMQDKWTDLEAKQLLEATVDKHAEAATLHPSVGDRPLWTDKSEVGKALFQFKLFGAVSVRKSMIPLAQGLAHGDFRAAQALATMVAAGALVYVTKQKISGQPLETNPYRFALEVLDKSNLLGWAGEFFYPLLWQAGSQAFSRWGDRQSWETLTGPTAGTVVDAFDLRPMAHLRNQFMGPVPGLKPYTRGDLHRIRRLIPFNQYWPLRRAVNALETEAGDKLGLPPQAPRRPEP